MPTLKQRKVAKKLIEALAMDNPPTGGQMLVNVGYSKSMSTAKVNDVLESEGVREALNDLGFTEEGAKSVVQEIMYNNKVDPSARLKATDQVFKIQGTYAPEKSVNVNVELEPSDRIKELAEMLRKKISDT